MDIIVRRSALDSCEKVFERSLCLEEAAESVVPDTQPDAEYILCAGGAAFIRSKDVNAGRVGLSAQAEVTALYAAEGSGGICALSAVVPISVELEAPEVTPESLAVADICLTNVEAKLLNPRKAVIRCTASVRLECYNPGELYVSAGLEGEGAEKVETLCGTCTVNPVVCVKEKTFAVSDEYQLQPGLLPIGTLLASRAELCRGGVRSVGSRVVFSGSVRTRLLYLSNGGELCSAQFETEFSQMLDTDCEFTSLDCTVISLLTAAYVEPVTLTGGEKGVSAEYHIVSQCVCADTVTVQCIKDCYSNAFELSPEYAQSAAGAVRRRAAVRASAHEELAASPVPVSVCRADCCLGETEYDRGALRCQGTVTVLYTAADGRVYSARRRLGFEAVVELEPGESVGSAGAQCAECTATIAQGGFEIRAAADFELISEKRAALSQLTELGCGEALDLSGRPSVTVIRAAEGDTLWSIGKRCHSTAAEISRLNNLGENPELTGRVLLIPRAR